MQQRPLIPLVTFTLLFKTEREDPQKNISKRKRTNMADVLDMFHQKHSAFRIPSLYALWPFIDAVQVHPNLLKAARVNYNLSNQNVV